MLDMLAVLVFGGFIMNFVSKQASKSFYTFSRWWNGGHERVYEIDNWLFNPNKPVGDDNLRTVRLRYRLPSNLFEYIIMFGAVISFIYLYRSYVKKEKNTNLTNAERAELAKQWKSLKNVCMFGIVVSVGMVNEQAELLLFLGSVTKLYDTCNTSIKMFDDLLGFTAFFSTPENINLLYPQMGKKYKIGEGLVDDELEDKHASSSLSTEVDSDSDTEIEIEITKPAIKRQVSDSLFSRFRTHSDPESKNDHPHMGASTLLNVIENQYNKIKEERQKERDARKFKATSPWYGLTFYSRYWKKFKIYTRDQVVSLLGIWFFFKNGYT
jgi:hypothetical protein